MHGGHLIKSWSRTQAIVALSSGEAELYGMVKASAELLGAMSAMHDFGNELQGHVLGDSSAALGIVKRQILGKTRHIDTNFLWVQEKQATKQIAYEKTAGNTNPADLLTKALTGDRIKDLCARNEL